jgi:ribosomal protein S18 acetylase RimI-like enzyme
MHIRRLEDADTETYRRLRLWALQESSAVYGSSYIEEVRMPLEAVKQRLGLHNPDESFVLGAFSDAGRLVGIIGCYRASKIKARHKAHIWGMFVAPDFRGQGIGRALLEETIERAAQMPGVRWLNLDVVAGNDAARALYASRGFVSFGLEPEANAVDGEFRDLEYMGLRLPE